MLFHVPDTWEAFGRSTCRINALYLGSIGNHLGPGKTARTRGLLLQTALLAALLHIEKETLPEIMLI